MPNELYLIDTSVWLFALKRDFVPDVKARIDYLLRHDQVVTTGIITLEIISGARTPKEYQRLEDRFNALETIDSDAAMWQAACALGFTIRRKGLTVPHTDVLIAACALESDSIILHADRHFDLMARHVGVKVESLVDEIRGSI